MDRMRDSGDTGSNPHRVIETQIFPNSQNIENFTILNILKYFTILKSPIRVTTSQIQVDSTYEAQQMETVDTLLCRSYATSILQKM